MRARREALRVLQDAADRGSVPESAPADLELGQYAGFWVADGRVFAASAPPRERPATVEVVVDPCGCGDASGRCGLERDPRVVVTPDVERRLRDAAWWRSADGAWLAVVETPPSGV